MGLTNCRPSPERSNCSRPRFTRVQYWTGRDGTSDYLQTFRLTSINQMAFVRSSRKKKRRLGQAMPVILVGLQCNIKLHTVRTPMQNWNSTALPQLKSQRRR